MVTLETGMKLVEKSHELFDRLGLLRSMNEQLKDNNRIEVILSSSCRTFLNPTLSQEILESQKVSLLVEIGTLEQEIKELINGQREDESAVAPGVSSGNARPAEEASVSDDRLSDD